VSYTVASGDTLSSIARRFSTTARSIAFWNRTTYPSLDPESDGYAPDRIRIGWVLQVIPGAVVDEEELPDGSGSPAPSTGSGATPVPATAAPSADATAPPAGSVSRVVRHGDRATREVALTFDMGGRMEPALDILEYLIDHDVHATVFPTGKTGTETAEGRAALELVSEHRDEFSLGNHSWSHPDFRDLDDAAMRDQLERTEAAIVALTGMSTKPWFRPPYGGLDDQVPASVGAAGWDYTVLWEIDTIDWRPESDGGPTAQDLVDKVAAKVQPGSIVLMHLGGYHTYEALPGILAALDDRGLEPVSLEEMFGAS
jgi:peptidoglycan/xylan/chitin deacetylase (PgdA/CDA1 family)